MQKSNIKNKFKIYEKLIAVFLAAIFIRLICLYIFLNVTNYDLNSYLQVGELTLKGINIYPNIANFHHPYLPFFLYVEALAVKIGLISRIGQIGQIGIIKIFLIIFDLGILYLIYLLSKKNLKTAFLYAVNPVTILTVTLHGQFDVIPVFFILLSIYLLNKKKKLLSILSYSFSILTKTWPILFVIPIVKNIKNQKLLTLIILFPILFILIYLFIFKSSMLDIGKTLIGYQGLWGIWGIWGLLGKWRIRWRILSILTFIISFFFYSSFNKEKNPLKNILHLLFFFFIFTTNFSIQYFVWIIPFLIIIKPKKYFQLIILMTMYLISFYFVWVIHIETPKWLAIIQNITGFTLWLSFIKVWYLSTKIS